jgi:hypothetical protein
MKQLLQRFIFGREYVLDDWHQELGLLATGQ